MEQNIIKTLMFLLFLIALSVNFYYGSIGVFPIDTFAHFDPAYRILNGSSPFKDYWTVSGLSVDYIQSLFFLIFGVNWFGYIMHSSLLNAILAISVFYFFNKFGLKKYFSFFYSLCFSLLAYPPVGVPFSDHHSSFFSLLGIFFLLIAIKDNKFLHWFLVPMLFFIAFLSKQTPAAYIISFCSIFLIYYSIVKKSISWIFPILISSFVCILIFSAFLFFNKINFTLFLTQYFYFPQSIGAERISNLNLSLKGTIFHFKFIYLASLPLFYFTLTEALKNKKFLVSNKFFNNIIFLFFTLILIFHQLITKNQTYIFFLIPLLLGFSHTNFKLKKNNVFFVYSLVFLCLFASIKYHLRFNEGRKFMELSNVNLNLSKEASYIDKKLQGLKWITPNYRENVQEEMMLIKKTISHLKMEKKNMIVMTHYQFFSSVIEKDLMSPNRWFTSDGVSYPLKQDKYFVDYKHYIQKIISKKKIDLIYTIKPIEIDAISIFFEANCLKTTKINKILYEHNLHACQ